MVSPGILLVDKPAGLTSHDVVARTRRAFGTRKVGHAGTLDPMATGLLVIGIEGATRLLTYIVGADKTYAATIRLGQTTSSDDADGDIVRQADPEAWSAVTDDAVAAGIAALTGEISQVPSSVSAIKVDGERAYDLARDGEVVELAPRPVEIHHLTLVDQPDNDRAVFEAECGKGTYVRALARDMGRILGTFGHICALRRTLVGPFSENDMIPLDQLEALCDRAASGEGSLADALMPVETALDDIPALAVTRADAARLHRGQAVLLRGRDAPTSSGTVYVTVAGRLLALAEVGNGEIIPKRVFNLTGLTASSGRNERN